MANCAEIDENETFVECDEEDIASLLTDSKSKNTKRSTNTSLNRLRAYLRVKKYPELEEISDDELPELLTKFYSSARTKKAGEMYQTSSFKVLRAGLNRYFRINRTLDIVTDHRFMRANMVFDGVQVKAKKTGKGVTRSTPHISEADLKKIGEYFDIDHITNPQPTIL